MDEIRKLLSDIPNYDPGIINDFGGGNTEWWIDYIRAEVGRANEHWQSIVDAALASLPQSEGETPDHACEVCGEPISPYYEVRRCKLHRSEPAPSSEKALRERCETLAQKWDDTPGREDFAPNFAEELRALLVPSPAPSESPQSAPEAPGEKRVCNNCGRDDCLVGRPTCSYDKREDWIPIPEDERSEP